MSGPKAYQRLLDLALALTAAGRVGVTTPELIQRVGYRPDDSGKRALMRDLDDLRAAGLEIGNNAEPGGDARYVLRPGDTRWRLAFTAEQRTALQAALAVADEHGKIAIERGDLPVDLDRVREAVRSGCVMKFVYNGRGREVDPISWRWVAHELVVEGWEQETGMVKSFTVARILDLELGPPGSSQTPDDVPRPGLDPITWQVDPPLEAVIECPGFAEDVIALLGGEQDGDVVRVMVTNRLVFLARIVELGERARLVAPEELRAELRELLKGAL